MECSETYRDWSRLSADMHEMILKKLALNDFLSFSNVCKLWRAAVVEVVCRKPSLGFPWLVMSGESRNKTRSCLSILENKVRHMEIPKSYGGYFWGSFEDWFIMIKHFDTDFWKIRISLLNPFSGAEVLLPNAQNIHYKLVFSGTPGEQTCMYLLLGWSIECMLWIPGTQGWCGCRVGKDFSDLIVDAISFNGCFFVLTVDYNICVIDAESASLTIKREGISPVDFETRFYKVGMPSEIPRDICVLRHLMELNGEALLVCRFLRYVSVDTEKFEIFRLDFDLMAWVKLDSLGDYVLFISRNYSKSFLAKELGDGMANCIYFTNEYEPVLINEWDMMPKWEGSTVDDWGIFRLDGNGSNNFSYKAKLDKWPPIWITAPLWYYFQKKKT